MRAVEKHYSQNKRKKDSMADVEMTDAAVAPKAKSSKTGPSGDTGEKKRFEVKKVR